MSNKISKLVLSEEEFNVLEKIARKIKMDCWFEIRQCQGKETYDYVYDMEEDKRTSLRNGVKLLNEGISSYEECSLNEEEILAYEKLLVKLKLEGNPEYATKI